MMVEYKFLGNKWICYDCIGEQFLSSAVFNTGKKRSCSYCDKTRTGIKILDLADSIETAFSQHYQRTSEQPDSFQYTMLADKESDYEWYREGECTVDAIMNAADIPSDAAADVQEILTARHADIEMHKMSEECEFDADAHYEEILPNSGVWREEWQEFEKSLKYEARYFNKVGLQHLTEIFGGIDKLSTHDDRSLVISAGPEMDLCKIYRARVFQSDEKLCEALKRPDIHMVNPPPKFAVAGRMNAHGISVFYGATDQQTAIAEVRPPVGSQVLVAQFSIMQTLRLLDLTALDAVFENGSIFDEGWAARLERAAFLKTLSQRMTRPVMPEDEALEYLPTQAIADFLASENEPRLDGILFPSVQTEGQGLNIVLFQRAVSVVPIDVPKGMLVDARTGLMGEDGWERDYWVTETIYKEQEVEGQKNGEADLLFRLMEPGSTLASNSFEPKTLNIELENMFVHIVDRVRYECSECKVTRTRTEYTQSNF